MTEPLDREALALLEAASRAGLDLRLLGGLAVRLRCPAFSAPPFSREVGDMDLACAGPSRKVEDFLRSRGFSPDAEFNMYNGGSRLLFHSPGGTKVDVFVGAFSMCHEIPFKERMTQDGISLPLAELLATKLQVVEANAKDLSDAACLLADHALAPSDGDSINTRRLGELCGADWGLYRTLGLSAAKVEAWTEAAAFPDASLKDLVRSRVAELRELIEGCPKGPKWKLRAALGDRVRWYETVEEA